MSLRSFEVAYRFGGCSKTGDLATWLADSLAEGFEGDLGLTQTTRLAVHQTKVRLLAAAIDAVETADGQGPIAPDRVDRDLVERGLLACVARHAKAWRALASESPPSFAHAFELCAADPKEPAFLQCPVPEDAAVIDEANGLKLLPDYGFAVPSQVAAGDDARLAFQLMAFAGKLSYVRGYPTGSRPLGQAVAINVPGRPWWRVRHEVETTLGWIALGRERLGFTGDVVFAWLLPFLPQGRPIPRGHQHPCLLDVGSPIRVRRGRQVTIYNRPCKVGTKEAALGSAALARRNAWAATGLPGIPIGAGKGSAKAGKDPLAAIGLDAAPEAVQRPYGKVPSSADVLKLIETARFGGADGQLGAPVLDIYRSEVGDTFDLPPGGELVIEGEPIGVSTTAAWIELRVPLPDPGAGAESLRGRWSAWQQAVGRQFQARRSAVEALRRAAEQAWLGRRRTTGQEPPQSVRRKARTFAARWAEQVESTTDAALWSVAVRTWQDANRNQALWSEVLNSAVRDAATEAFEALGGFDDAATVLASSGRFGLLRLAHRQREAT
jgi:hypothetical protein